LPLSANLYDGPSLVRGSGDRAPLYTCPPFFATAIKRPELSVYRGLLITKDLDPHNPHPAPIPPPGLRKSRNTGMTDRHSAVSYNKGMPLHPSEMYHLSRDSTWVGIKHNGTMGKLIHARGSVEVVLETGTVHKFNGYVSPILEGFILQVEYVEGECIVTDVLLPPWGDSGSFIVRWRWLVSLFNQFEGRWPFRLQRWFRLGSPESFGECLLKRGIEGVVLQSHIAQPGSMKHGVGSARYVKKRWTLDLYDSETKKVSEYCERTNERIRTRPDKTRPNNAEQIKRVKDAPMYNDFVFYVKLISYGELRNTKYGVDLTFAKALAQKVLDGVPVADWSKSDLVVYMACYTDSRFVSDVLADTYDNKLALSVFGVAKRAFDQRPPVSAATNHVEDDDIFPDDEAPPGLLADFEAILNR